MSNFVNFGGLVLDVEWFPLVDARDPETIFVQDRNDGEWRFVDAATLDAPVCAALRAWAAGLAPEQEEEDEEDTGDGEDELMEALKSVVMTPAMVKAGADILRHVTPHDTYPGQARAVYAAMRRAARKAGKP